MLPLSRRTAVVGAGRAQQGVPRGPAWTRSRRRRRPPPRRRGGRWLCTRGAWRRTRCGRRRMGASGGSLRQASTRWSRSKTRTRRRSLSSSPPTSSGGCPAVRVEPACDAGGGDSDGEGRHPRRRRGGRGWEHGGGGGRGIAWSAAGVVAAASRGRRAIAGGTGGGGGGRAVKPTSTPLTVAPRRAVGNSTSGTIAWPRQRGRSVAGWRTTSWSSTKRARAAVW